MTSNVFKTSVLGAIILVAIGAGVLYVLDAPDNVQAMPGSISGTLSYPSSGVPALRVCAEPLLGGEPICIATIDDVTEFRIPLVRPGEYHVFAQLANPESLGLEDYAIAKVKAYATAYVECGMRTECTDHTLTTILVRAGTDTPNVLPADWYR